MSSPFLPAVPEGRTQPRAGKDFLNRCLQIQRGNARVQNTEGVKISISWHLGIVHGIWIESQLGAGGGAGYTSWWCQEEEEAAFKTQQGERVKLKTDAVAVT